MLQLINSIKEEAPNALYTIKQLVLTTFKKVLAVAKLIHSAGWHWLQCSYCKCVCLLLDAGVWMCKNMNILAHGLPEGFELPRCNNDCEHLLPDTRLGRQCWHKIVICCNCSNLPQQIMLTDPMVKGKLPHGLLRCLNHTHTAWLKHAPHMHDALVDRAVTAFVEQILPLLNVDANANASEMEAGPHDEDLDKEHGAASESESSAASSDDTIDEADFDADGLRKEKVLKVVHPDLPKYKTQATKVRRHTRFIPGRDERFELGVHLTDMHSKKAKSQVV